MPVPRQRLFACVARSTTFLLVLCSCLTSKECDLSGTVADGYYPQEGDVLFQALPKNVDLVVAIEGVTGSNYSHCGVIVKGDKGNWQVFESIGAVGSVPLKNWIARGRGGKFAAYRLREKHAVEVATLLAALPRYADRPYDVRYRMDDQFIYCS